MSDGRSDFEARTAEVVRAEAPRWFCPRCDAFHQADESGLFSHEARDIGRALRGDSIGSEARFGPADEFVKDGL